MQLGRVCLKIAGRDAGQHEVIIGVADKMVLVDGQVRRRKCNPHHLEPLAQTVDIVENASHEQVVAALQGLGIAVVERKPKLKKAEPVVESSAKKSKK